MGSKTISLEIDAYERLKAARLEIPYADDREFVMEKGRASDDDRRCRRMRASESTPSVFVRASSP